MTGVTHTSWGTIHRVTQAFIENGSFDLPDFYKNKDKYYERLLK